MRLSLVFLLIFILKSSLFAQIDSMVCIDNQPFEGEKIEIQLEKNNSGSYNYNYQIQIDGIVYGHIVDDFQCEFDAAQKSSDLNLFSICFSPKGIPSEIEIRKTDQRGRLMISVRDGNGDFYTLGSDFRCAF